MGLKQLEWADFAVSFGYRHIIPREQIDMLPGRMINIHISLLPWNRGADPNLWSFLEDSPKGVTIHQIDAGIDTGPILLQRELFFDPDAETLRSSYQKLVSAAVDLFALNWPALRSCRCMARPQSPGGSCHSTSDRRKVAALIEELGYDTPVGAIRGRCLGPGGTA